MKESTINKIRCFWNKLMTPYDEERLDEFYWATNIICSECGVSNYDVCDNCRVTHAKRSFTNKFNKNI